MLFFGKKKKKNKKERDIEKKRPRLDLHSETKKSIWGIIFFTFAVIIFLSFFGRAGDLGVYLERLLASSLGLGKFLIPILFIAASVIFLGSGKRNAYLSTFFGGFLLISSLLGFFQVVGGDEKQLGGYLGKGVTLPLLGFLGEWATLIILGAVFVISILMFLNIPLRLFREKEDQEGGDEDSEEEEESEEINKKAELALPKISGIFKKSSEKSQKQDLGKNETRGDEEDAHKFLEKTEIAYPASYRFPPFNLLASDSERPTSGDIKANSNIIKRTLQNFGIEVEMSEVNIGPTVTQYTLKPAEGVKLSRILALQNDLSLALAAHPLRLEAPIPGKSFIGIEIPNKSVAMVRLRSLLENPNFLESPSNLIFALGRDVAGNPVFADLKKMPHLLMAGSTGSGKTVGLNCLINSLLYRNSSETLKLVLIDPKRVEFPIYNGLPHLLTPVITDPQKTVLSLRWLVSEMERRFGILSSAKSRDIVSYNSQIVKKKGESLMPYIIVIIDELADLMAARGKEVEAAVVRLAQMARAVGIHLVVATQRPSVEVITGLIKANITSRIAFEVASQIDSRTILDMAGAEKLLGNGDMLYISADTPKPKRIQGSFVSDKEVKKVVDYIESENINADEEAENPSIEQGRDNDTEEALSTRPNNQFLEANLTKTTIDFDSMEDGSFDDELYGEAKKVVIQSQKASASLLQRRLRIGYARAARLVDMLEEKGVVGPGEGAKPREVYIDEEKLT